MKKFALLLLVPVFIFYSCNKDEETDEPQNEGLTPKQEQWGFAINYTATWCGPCGDWGAPLIHELSETGDVVAITVHASGDPMYNSGLYGSFNSERPAGGGIPSFWIGDTKTTDTSAMTTLLEQAPVAGIAIESTKNDTSMTVKTKTEFFEAGSGKYFLSVLILEDGIDGSSSAGEYEQNGVEDPTSYQHDFVLRASSVNGNSYGEEIVISPEKGATVEKEYEIILSPAWGQDVYAVAILWQVDLFSSPNFKFINAIK
ncbi:MAG: Omp28-related outer membrane protein [Bacteroidales bacterium]|nr:Omp28-related outer membrane protein [Bacteroidales bacterium]